jgi:cytochrome c
MSRELARRIAGAICAMPISLAGAVVASSAVHAGDDNRPGAAIFEARCMACHSLDSNRVGPMLRDVVGRKVASVRSYDYSDALKRLRGRWDAPRLDAWLRDPQAVAPGAKMGFALQDAQERRQVIMYLTSTASRPPAK